MTGRSGSEATLEAEMLRVIGIIVLIVIILVVLMIAGVLDAIF